MSDPVQPTTPEPMPPGQPMPPMHDPIPTQQPPVQPPDIPGVALVAANIPHYMKSRSSRHADRRVV